MCQWRPSASVHSSAKIICRHRCTLDETKLQYFPFLAVISLYIHVGFIQDSGDIMLLLSQRNRVFQSISVMWFYLIAG